MNIFYFHNYVINNSLVSILYQAEGSKKLRTFTIHPTKIQYTRFMNRQNFEVLIPKVGKWIVRDAIHTIDLKFNVGTSLIQFNATMNERNRFGWGKMN